MTTAQGPAPTTRASVVQVCGGVLGVFGQPGIVVVVMVLDRRDVHGEAVP